MAQGAGKGVSGVEGPSFPGSARSALEWAEILFLCDGSDLGAGSCWERPDGAGLVAVGCAASQRGQGGWAEGFSSPFVVCSGLFAY